MVTVTIGMPVYNAAEYLDETLENLTAQSFSDFTLLISDNCSTDETPTILEQWAKKDPRIQVIRQKENIGGLRNFDYVLQHAKSEWFMFASHDDKWSPNYIETLYNAVKNKPESDLAVPRVAITFDDGREDVILPIPEQDFSATGTKRIRLFLKHAHGSWVYGLHRRENLLKAQISANNFGYVWASDLVTILPYILSGRVTADDKALFSHLTTDSSWIKYKPRKLKDQWGIYRAFWREVCKALKDAPLTRGQKLALMPSLVRYVDRHSCKLRRIVKSAVLYPFRKG